MPPLFSKIFRSADLKVKACPPEILKVKLLASVVISSALDPPTTVKFVEEPPMVKLIVVSSEKETGAAKTMAGI